MSEIELFKTNTQIERLKSSEVTLEKELQTLIENNMETFFGVRFLKSEYKIANGRIDSLGIDENYCPVIFEYKRSINENVINQGLFYLDWLLDHKADFKLLVIEKFGKKEAEKIDWSAPLVICIANDFTKYDIHAVNQMGKNIKLVKYKKYNNDLILFEHLNAPITKSVQIENSKNTSKDYKTHLQKVESLSEDIKLLYDNICDYIESLGDDITANQLKYYIAYKKVQNIVSIEAYLKHICLYLKIDPNSVEIEKGFTRDVSNIGHLGTGNLEITIKNATDFEKAKPLIDRAYYEG